MKNKYFMVVMIIIRKMGEMQIVHDLIKNINDRDNVMGNRYLICENNTSQIHVYNGTEWEIINIGQKPTLVCITKKRKIVIVYDHIIWNMTKDKWFICDECGNLTDMKIQVNDGLCIHCYFTKVYEEGNWEKHNNEPMSIGMYINRFGKNHLINQCKKNKCFLCDYKKGRIFTNIKDRGIIYNKNMVKELTDKTIIVFI